MSDSRTLSRRSVLHWAGGAAGAAAFNAGSLLAAGRSRGERTLVHLYLNRGGDQNGLLDVSRGYTTLGRWYDGGRLAFVAGAGAGSDAEPALQYLPGAVIAPLWAARAAGIEDMSTATGWAAWEGVSVVTPGQPVRWDSAALAAAASAAQVGTPFPETADGRAMERVSRLISASDRLSMGPRVISLALGAGLGRAKGAETEFAEALAAFAEAGDRNGDLARTVLYTEAGGKRNAARLLVGGDVLGGQLYDGAMGQDEFNDVLAQWLGSVSERPSRSRLRFLR